MPQYCVVEHPYFIRERKSDMFRSDRIAGLALAVVMVCIALSHDAAGGQSVLLVGNETSGEVTEYSLSGSYLGVFASGINGASCVTIGPSGDVYVSNYKGVNVYSPSGSLLTAITTGFAAGQSQVAANGDILVNSYYGGAVYAYSPTGTALGVFSNPGLDRAYFSTFDSMSNLYITDQFSGVVERISSAGVNEGAYISNLPGVTGIAFDSKGDLFACVVGAFAADGQDKIVEYSPTGSYLGIITETGLDTPVGLVIGLNGNLFVANGDGNTITEYTTSGQYLGVFAGTGLDTPIGIAFTTASVPEPSSVVLLLVGVAVIPCFMARTVTSSRSCRR
jgi:hypothetical protein